MNPPVPFTGNKNCCVPQCNTRQRKGVSLHIFPSNALLKKEWIRLLKIGKKVSNRMTVCSLHFVDNDYLPRRKDDTIKKKFLKKTAKPSQKLPVVPSDSGRSETGRGKQKQDQRASRLENRKPHEIPFNASYHVCDEDLQQLPGFPVTNVPSLLSDMDLLADVCCKEISNQDHLSGCNTTSCETQTEYEANVITQTSFSLLDILNTDASLKMFTGLPSLKLLDNIVICIERLDGKQQIQFPVKGLVLIVLVKLKLNVTFNILASLFKIPVTTCLRYFQYMIFPLATVCRQAIVWPEKSNILQNIPKCFSQFRDVSIILDCTEISVQSPKCLKCRILTYSRYKGCQTVKLLIGVSPAGLITFISDAYGGRASDKFITLHSEILKRLCPFRDSVMVDKGFKIDDECAKHFINLIRPHFVKGGKPLPQKSVEHSTSVSQARVHVERTIQRFKLFNMFNKKLEWSMLKYINELKDIAAGLVNLSSPILANDKF